MRPGGDGRRYRRSGESGVRGEDAPRADVEADGAGSRALGGSRLGGALHDDMRFPAGRAHPGMPVVDADDADAADPFMIRKRPWQHGAKCAPAAPGGADVDAEPASVDGVAKPYA